MSVVTGFYREAGLYMPCQKCKKSMSVGLTDLFFALHDAGMIKCEHCQSEYQVNVELLDPRSPTLRAAVLSDATEACGAGHHETYIDGTDYKFCPDCGERLLPQTSHGG